MQNLLKMNNLCEAPKSRGIARKAFRAGVGISGCNLLIFKL
jgi:hypothetical protein